jgi:hypothetical protein
MNIQEKELFYLSSWWLSSCIAFRPLRIDDSYQSGLLPMSFSPKMDILDRAVEYISIPTEMRVDQMEGFSGGKFPTGFETELAFLLESANYVTGKSAAWDAVWRAGETYLSNDHPRAFEFSNDGSEWARFVSDRWLEEHTLHRIAQSVTGIASKETLSGWLVPPGDGGRKYLEIVDVIRPLFRKYRVRGVFQEEIRRISGDLFRAGMVADRDHGEQVVVDAYREYVDKEESSIFIWENERCIQNQDDWYLSKRIARLIARACPSLDIGGLPEDDRIRLAMEITSSHWLKT